MPKKVSFPQDETSLANLAERLQGARDRLNELIKSLKVRKEPQLAIFYFKEMMRGIEGIESFAESGHEQFKKLRAARGDFVGGGTENPELIEELTQGTATEEDLLSVGLIKASNGSPEASGKRSKK